jgi:translation initiation factor IF-2
MKKALIQVFAVAAALALPAGLLAQAQSAQATTEKKDATAATTATGDAAKQAATETVKTEAKKGTEKAADKAAEKGAVSAKAGEVAKPAADKKIDETTAKVVKVEGAKTEAKAAKMGTKVDEKAPKTTDAVKATDAKATTEAKPAEKAGDKKVEEKKPENKN